MTEQNSEPTREEAEIVAQRAETEAEMVAREIANADAQDADMTAGEDELLAEFSDARR